MYYKRKMIMYKSCKCNCYEMFVGFIAIVNSPIRYIQSAYTYITD